MNYMSLAGIPLTHARVDTSARGRQLNGLWQGRPRSAIYHHIHKLHDRVTAMYTPGTYKFNEQWELVPGVRYANDRKHAKELRGG